MARSEEDDVNANEEEDYLTMTFDDPVTYPRHETLTQKKKRQAKDAEERARTQSKKTIAAAERAKLESALNNSSIDTSSKAFKMMEKLGYKPGTALGVGRAAVDLAGTKSELPDDRLLEPVGLDMKEGRSGIGADADKKRKIREEFERIQGVEKKRQVEEVDFRERQTKEREEKKLEGQFWGAMKVAERLDEEDISEKSGKSLDATDFQGRPLKTVNVMWRGLARDRLSKERERRMRYDLQQSLSRLPTYDDPNEDKIDKIALGRKERLEEVDLELEEDDEELETFEALPVKEKLTKLLSILRQQWHYCFWCKCRYPNEEMDGCPGQTEDDHD